MSEAYLGNPNLKKVNVKQEYTKEQIVEIQKCMKDPIYFIKNYIQIVSLDKGLVPFELYDFQEKLVDTFHNNRFTICKMPRQSGKSTTIISYLLYYSIFNDNKNIAILANKAATARDILSRYQLAYENLPSWLQQGVINWNKGNIELENGSKLVAAATSSSSVRGSSFNIIFLDEFAYVPQQIAESFFSSVYPTISSGKDTKVMIVSTPHGMNMFYKLWVDAEENRNLYKPIEVHWSEVPGRDEKWKEETIKNTSKEQFEVEFECEFVGSIDTLIKASKLRTMTHKPPIYSKDGLDIFHKPVKGEEYFITADVARGTLKDYSALVVFNGKAPYKIMARYKSNEIKPLIFPHVIQQVAKQFNNAHVLIEVNDLGQQVADTLHYELEYDNILMAFMRGRNGQILGAGFSKRGTQLGVRMTKQVKRIGCTNLKTLVEDNKFVIEDYETIKELSTFIRRASSFEAEEGANDDIVICLVIFSWLVNQRYFKEMTNSDVRAMLFQEQENAIEQDMAPFGFMDDGLNDAEAEVDEYGTMWHPVTIHKGDIL